MTRFTRRTLLAGSAILASLAAAPAFAQDKGLIGIAMPNKSTTRWISDGDSMVKEFQARGYQTDLQFAEDDIPTQLTQVESMIVNGAKVLVIAAIDGTTLTEALKQAADKGVKVVAYDRLIRDSANVDYYTTFDNFQVGVLQAQSLLKGLGDGAGPFNIELFGGSPDDNNAFFFYDGAMSVLQPLIDQGRLVVVSGQTGIDRVGTLRWDGQVAQARMENLIAAFYAEKDVHAVLAANDSLAIGVISALKAAGYGTGSKKMPIINGQDAEIPSVKSIMAREQFATVFKDTRELAKVTADLVDAALSGREVPINDTKTYNNGIKTVPSYLLKPVLVDASNLKVVLIDGGYYTEEQLQ